MRSWNRLIEYHDPASGKDVTGLLLVLGGIIKFRWHDRYISEGSIDEDGYPDWSNDVRFATGDEVSMEDIIQSHLQDAGFLK